MEQFTLEQHHELKAAQAKFNTMRNEAEPFLKEIGKDIAARIHAAHKEHGFKTTHYYEDWFCYDFISIEFDDESASISIEYWEDGRCGNSDECLHTITVTDELLTEEGRKAYVDRWIEEQKMKQTEEARKKEHERLEKIKRLEAEIQQLTQTN
jgi:hypothetical protein